MKGQKTYKEEGCSQEEEYSREGGLELMRHWYEVESEE